MTIASYTVLNTTSDTLLRATSLLEARCVPPREGAVCVIGRSAEYSRIGTSSLVSIHEARCVPPREGAVCVIGRSAECTRISTSSLVSIPSSAVSVIPFREALAPEAQLDGSRQIPIH
eukprot:1188150-Prorocentrum_minimum.AAC.2